MDPFVYQYAVGGAVFFVGVLLAARQGYVGLRGRPAARLAVVLGGFAGFALLQGWLQYAPMQTAEPVAFDGRFQRENVLGTPLDYTIVAAYFLVILAIGAWFGRGRLSTREFFFGGQRFRWWLIALSLVATTVGSYSFVKYGQAGFAYGLSSSQTYLNDWFWMPLLMFGWLPILYFSRVTSIPEYFERRFGRDVRLWSAAMILLYLVGYVGVNLYTMGVVLNKLLGWEIIWSAIIVAGISAIYVTMGGQTSVIMTDLFQGVMLLGVGLLLLALGVDHLGGFDMFWRHLPRSHRMAFPDFNANPSFSAVGIFWQDAIANSAFFYFLNQGMVMRFLAARSIHDARKAAVFMPLILMPIAACVVASGGWVARAFVHAGRLPATLRADEAFYVAAEFLCAPGVFGLVIAALTAALMSTLDTLITAVAAIAVNDFYKPLLRRDATEQQQLRAARVCSLAVAILGIALVPVFATFKTIYAAHGAFTAAVTPPLVVTLLASVFWPRFTRTAAVWTLAGGMAAILLSIFAPSIIRPFAHGVPMGEAGDDLFAGMRQYKFMRALFGLAVSAVIAIAVTLLSRPEPLERRRGLVWGTVRDALMRLGVPGGRERPARRALAAVRYVDADGIEAQDGDPLVPVSAPLASMLEVAAGDLISIGDRRWWFGGLRSIAARVGAVTNDPAPSVALTADLARRVGASNRADVRVLVERLL
ncbi:MAG: hypothetical protein D6744_02985 [Planctomycetota bacterium]|nr:MAG: hypothetical protein D6744_02985 [Planctomycetota bacterium]